MTFRMELNDGRVAHFFGAHPERGRLLPGVKLRSTAGIGWQNFGRKLDRVEVSVSPVVCLRFIKKGVWEVTVAKPYEGMAKEWLSNLMVVKPRKEGRRRHHPREHTTPPMSFMRIDRGFS
jgi:hypothetical protein